MTDKELVIVKNFLGQCHGFADARFIAKATGLNEEVVARALKEICASGAATSRTAKNFKEEVLGVMF